MVVYLAGLLSLLLGALSLGPSFAHVLEAPPRLFVWSPELWREATVFNGQFALFAKVGGPLDVATILATCFLSYLLSNDRPAGSRSPGGAADQEIERVFEIVRRHRVSPMFVFDAPVSRMHCAGNPVRELLPLRA